MLCGQSLPHPVYSVGNSVQVIFTSLSSQYPGFNATYTAMTNSSVCPNMATLNETSGVLTSPYYPRRFPSNEKCSWKITASKGERIVLVMKDIDIGNCGLSCTCNYLEIQNGLSSDGISGRRRCRSDEDSGIVYHSAKDVLRVTFVSQSYTNWQYNGFKATYIKVKYSATTTACVSGEYLNGFSGVFSTPNFPSNYPQYSRCTWNITVPSGYIIKLSFFYFRLEPNQYSPCYYEAPGARVTVTNVATNDGYQPFMLCGQSLPHPVHSVGNSVQVIFTSLNSQYPGFNATYTAISYSSVCPNMTILNETSGVITSPFYPRYHSNKRSCSWEIRARKGKRILLTIEDMDIEDMDIDSSGYWRCDEVWSCACGYLEIQGGSISGHDGPKWGVCSVPLTANATYLWFKERIKVLFVSESIMGWDSRFKISYTQVAFGVSGK
ncbi:unnamed protein product [Porites lobata]|uniref:CUB domain-containing protein n=1 Tax=Porites lobata TaxID=104759 RepID=A0ABN8QPS3_9CNID|nr:unnamed protein product [Porites lobata]